MKPSKVSLLALALLAAAYFGSLSSLETHFLLKSLVIVLPVQVGACVYLAYLYWAKKLPGMARHQNQK